MGHHKFLKCQLPKESLWLHPMQVLKQEEKDTMVQCIALKMLTDFTLMYNACVGVLLKRDAEGTRGRGSSPPSTPAAPKTDSPAQSLLFRCHITPQQESALKSSTLRSANSRY